MFTLSHIAHNQTSLRSVKTVVFDEDSRQVTAFGCTPDGGAVGEDGVCLYTSGKVFVMNANGSTVAVYSLE